MSCYNRLGWNRDVVQSASPLASSRRQFDVPLGRSVTVAWHTTHSTAAEIPSVRPILIRI